MTAHTFVGGKLLRWSHGREFSKAGQVALTVVALALATSSAAQAQCRFGAGLPTTGGGQRVFGFVAATSSAVTASVTSMGTAFQTQNSAFIASPQGSQSNEFAGGVWARGVGGRVDIDSVSSGTRTRSDLPGASQAITCSTPSRNDFIGVQGGVDIGRLDFGASGWNAHIGVTAGYFESNSSTQGGGVARSEVPFIGLYAALTGGGGFFLDAQIRGDFYNISVTEPSLSIRGNTKATGFGFMSSAGYFWSLGNIFIEPSVGVFYSSTSVDPLVVNPRFLTAGGPPLAATPTRLNFDNIETLLARVGIRVGTSFSAGPVALHPFAAVSVWREFSDDTGVSATIRQTGGNIGSLTYSSTRIGTFGQYSVGVAANVLNTGWLGYARLDYRNGENIEGFSVNGGLRYQFAPQTRVAAAPPPAVAGPSTWTGFYVGGFLGGAWSNNVTATERAPAYNGVGTTTSYGLDSSVIGGATIGYNHQMGMLVAGLEAEGGYLRLSGSASFPTSPGQDTVSSSQIGDWYTVLAGRIGLSLGPALIYAKGGAALVSITSSVIDSCQLAPCAPTAVNASGGNSVELTWAGGGGLEVALADGWSVKGEYLYLGTDQSYTVSGPGQLAGGSLVRRFNWRHDIPAVHTAKIGFNYRFGGATN